MVYEHGHFRLVQLNRANIPVPVQKELGIFQGYPETYEDAKAKFSEIPEEKRNIPYISASRIFVIYPTDATKSEVLQSLEFLIHDVKCRWKEPTKEA